MADSGLGLAQRDFEVARTDLAPLGNEAQEPKADRIGERGKHLRQLRSLSLAQRRGRKRGAAHIPIELHERKTLGGHEMLLTY
jgi:hypothetical protein